MIDMDGIIVKDRAGPSVGVDTQVNNDYNTPPVHPLILVSDEKWHVYPVGVTANILMIILEAICRCATICPPQPQGTGVRRIPHTREGKKEKREKKKRKRKARGRTRRKIKASIPLLTSKIIPRQH